MSKTIQGLRDDAREMLAEYLRDNPGATHNDVSDWISEIADTTVPVYDSDLMEVIASERGLAFIEPEIGHGIAGDNMIGKAQAIIYEEITGHLWDRLADIRDEVEGDEEWDDDAEEWGEIVRDWEGLDIE